MSETIKVLISEEEVNKRISEIGEQISKDYAGKQVHLVCVLKGGAFFMCELAKRITVPVSMDFSETLQHPLALQYSFLCLPMKSLAYLQTSR